MQNEVNDVIVAYSGHQMAISSHFSLTYRTSTFTSHLYASLQTACNYFIMIKTKMLGRTCR